MSIGELISMYEQHEIDLHPEFQRFYRWSPLQKSRLIESLLLGIPIPSIFVSQRQDGVWDVIDGLQRLSTIFEYVGILRDQDGNLLPALELQGTRFLPALGGKKWGLADGAPDALGSTNQRLIKRAKIDVKIVLRESDDSSKYELFQRLNTLGSPLSDQEVRNCLLIMAKREVFAWLRNLSGDEHFRHCIAISDRAADEQYDLELVVRFLVLRRLSDPDLRKVVDLGDFLTERIVSLALDPGFKPEHEAAAFQFAFKTLDQNLGEDSFKRHDPARNGFVGGFLISAFEVLALGLGYHYETYRNRDLRKDVVGVAKGLWGNQQFVEGIGSGVRASSRIPVTIPLGRKLFKS
ncbi:MAG: DUF262 domain-containing protein [Planctomycetes bacterium]|nr:DUF262 domain-containing protein [Planctomycetota bacterium]